MKNTEQSQQEQPPQRTTLMEESTLTPYHWQKEEESYQEVQRMLKQPYTLKQMKDQFKRNKESLKKKS